MWYRGRALRALLFSRATLFTGDKRGATESIGRTIAEWAWRRALGSGRHPPHIWFGRCVAVDEHVDEPISPASAICAPFGGRVEKEAAQMGTQGRM
jgi:hypothetical protein